MHKETIRPLLVEAVVAAKAQEAILMNPTQDRLSNWETLAALLEARQEARLKRALAELQLWLADRQWERQEAEERADRQWERQEAEERAERDTETPPSASYPTSRGRPAE
jgi:hypothetical protein